MSFQPNRKRRRSLSQAVLESLESRRLMHGGHDEAALHVSVNFQPAIANRPGGDLIDTGKIFADRGNGYEYGWNVDLSSTTRDRNAITSPNQRYDTLIQPQLNANGVWEIELPNGEYLLHLVAGDPSYADSVIQFAAEGNVVLDGATNAFTRWVESETLVDVQDERLTISNGAGAINNKLCFLEITDAGDDGTQVKISIPQQSANEVGGTATALVTRFGPTDEPLTVYYKLAGNAISDLDYTALTGSVEIPAGASSAPITISALDDELLESSETIDITLLPGDGYAMRFGQYASLNIVDNEIATVQTPYHQTPKRLSATIEAEDFDHGPANVAYRDLTAGNTPGAYRNGDVDIEPAIDIRGGFAVRYTRGGEWLNYTIDVPVSGTYRIETRVATPTKGGTFQLEFNGSNKTGAITLPTTGSFSTWKTLTKTGVKLTAGVQTMTLRINRAFVLGTEVGAFNWIRIYNDVSSQAKLTWTATTSAPLAREEGNGTTLGDNLYVFGGLYSTDYLATARVDIFNSITKKWTRGADMPEAVTHAPAVIIDGKFWLIAGYVGEHPGPATTHVWIYDPIANSWSAGPDLPEARGAGTAQIVGRQIHYFGGRNAERSIDQTTHYMYDLDNPDAGWAEKAPMLRARNHIASAVIDGKIYAIGGQMLEEVSLIDTPDLDMYDPTTDTWTKMADAPLALSHQHQATIVRNGKIIIMGGEYSHNTPQKEVLIYDPATNIWSYLGALPNPRRAMVAGLFGDKIIAFGGFGDGQHQATTWIGTLKT